MYIQWPVYGVYVPTCRPPLFLNLHSGLFIYKHEIGHAWLLSSRVVSRQYMEYVFCYGGMGACAPRH